MKKRVNELLCRQLNVPINMFESSLYEDQVTIDHMDMHNIAMEIEEKYGVRIPFEILSNINNTDEIAQYLEDKGVDEYPKFYSLLRKKHNLQSVFSIDESQKPRAAAAMKSIPSGNKLVRMISGKKEIIGARVLFLGQTFGGELVALSQSGAKEVVYINSDDRNEPYVKALIEDLGIPNVISKETTCEATGQFDIIIGKKALNEADNDRKAMFKLSKMMKEDGVIFYAIPNRLSPEYLLSNEDCKSHSDFGIQLLTRKEADEYYGSITSDWFEPLTYRSLNYYMDALNDIGLKTEIMNPNYLDYEDRLNMVEGLFDECKQKAAAISIMIPRSVRQTVSYQIETASNIFTQYKTQLSEIKSAHPEVAKEIADRLLLNYGEKEWYVLAEK